MATHKAPTQVTVVDHDEKSGFAVVVERTWKPAALVVAVIAAGILGSQFASSRARESVQTNWDTLNSALQEGGIEALAVASTELSGTEVESYALANEVLVATLERDYEHASSALDRLRATQSDLFTKATFPFDDDSVLTIADQLEKRIAAQRAWEADKTSLFENPPLPADAPKVKITTKLGSFVIGLYSDRAPKHVENFLKLCNDGFYVGTKFHRVLSGYMIEGGDPNTKEGETSTWGQGGPGYEIENEDTGLSHFEGVVTAMKTAGQEGSSGSLFAIATGPLHYLNKQRTVFGVITEGLDVVEQLDVSGDDIEDPSSGRPVDPIAIEATEVL